VVDALPAATIAVSTSSTVVAWGLCSQVVKSLTGELLKNGTIRAIVEIAGDEDSGL
jgi:hypothetical protein